MRTPWASLQEHTVDSDIPVDQFFILPNENGTFTVNPELILKIQEKRFAQIFVIPFQHGMQLGIGSQILKDIKNIFYFVFDDLFLIIGRLFGVVKNRSDESQNKKQCAYDGKDWI